jgi:hypothetical protein
MTEKMKILLTEECRAEEENETIMCLHVSAYEVII